MSQTQGTNDFVEAAVDNLKDGSHPFLLIALHNGDAEFRTYAIRCGAKAPKDVHALRHILREIVPAQLNELEASL